MVGQIYKRIRLAPEGLIIAPIAVMSAFFVVLLLVISWNSTISLPSSLAVGGLLAYAGAILLLYSVGTSSLRKLEKYDQTDSLPHLPNRRALHADIQSVQGEDVEIAL